MKRRLLSLAAAVSLSVSAGPPVAVAAPPNATVPAYRVTIPLSVDCSVLPSGRLARELLRAHAVCGFGQAAAGAISAQSSATGNCGSVSLTVGNAGAGYLQWRAEITSSMGPFVFASYSGAWRNLSRRTAGTLSRNFLGFTSDWVDSFRPYTRSGWISARMWNVGLITFWGLTCTNAQTVEDEAYVSGG